ncbi:phosphate ABC transporter permease subunit PstC [Tetragenococcus koreensis]|uniref:phosphate ABC transporter permease subunit PstC n=1 Tax=Tetragenococcus koreensis TaxID=290335 RepID=UPI001F40AA4F|nr:phosphate ABC transporter permease subunit PstC [Tetragenococcus koreensis]MCF1617660.1 phosphate ABC transporter permease subunit PstC [Tetragenococcus koreensis]MCF1622480.1 phosphate ABC transporter permease subunit PstC [Tetragenococcus koreensis]MCF1678598.1 phosphate ABC transporter permease subunit PstC [Tetragenococcus koreensis]MCF1681001.1 phosphate ABC transporter permease subunit PstC [Tetragenococcus koreensis]MCF1683264.1 phosphate ABC transporter permease subunit PstC [Tetrag
MENVKEVLTKKSKKSKLEQRGKIISFLCISIIVLVVLSIFYFVASKGLATFFVDKVNVFDFLFGTEWNPSQVGSDGQPMVGALPMIVGSFLVTFLSAIVATPFAIGAAVFMVEISPKNGQKLLQPVIELLVGIPSVVYGFIGLSIIVPVIRALFGGTGFGILAGTFVLFVMILPTVTTMTVDALKAVPRHYREASLALGATRWQTIYKVVLRAAIPGILTAVVFGMARAFGEALAIQMVIGNAALMPTSLVTPAPTLTSILTMGIGNTIMGTVENNVLWSLALILLLMSLIFNIVIRLIGKKGAMK